MPVRKCVRERGLVSVCVLLLVCLCVCVFTLKLVLLKGSLLAGFAKLSRSPPQFDTIFLSLS